MDRGRAAAAEVSGAQGVVELANLGTGLGLTIALVVSGLAFAWKYLMFVRVAAEAEPRRLAWLST